MLNGTEKEVTINVPDFEEKNENIDDCAYACSSYRV